MTELQRKGLLNYIEDNETLLKQGDFDKLVRRCPYGIRDQLIKLLDDELNTDILTEVHYQTFKWPVLKNLVKDIIKEPIVYYDNIFYDKRKTSHSIKFWRVFVPDMGDKQLVEYIKDKLDDHNICYNCVSVMIAYANVPFIVINLDNKYIEY